MGRHEEGRREEHHYKQAAIAVFDEEGYAKGGGQCDETYPPVEGNEHESGHQNRRNDAGGYLAVAPEAEGDFFYYRHDDADNDEKKPETFAEQLVHQIAYGILPIVDTGNEEHRDAYKGDAESPPQGPAE